MKAKFINENINTVLAPKTLEDIKKGDIGDIDPYEAINSMAFVFDLPEFTVALTIIENLSKEVRDTAIKDAYEILTEKIKTPY